MNRDRNVILLSIDALRADHLAYHGYSRETSPFLDELADCSTCFLNAFSASSHTREAVPALITGRHPDLFTRNGYRLVGESLATRLSDQGFRTAALHSNPYISRAYGYEKGFDEFYDDLLIGKHKLIALVERAINKFVLNKGDYHARASEINQRSLDWIDSLREDESFFLWNHYMDVHGPYNPPEVNSKFTSSISNSEAQSLYQKCIKQPEDISEEERNLLIDLYDGEICYLDRQLQLFFASLRERELLEDSLLIIVSDHGDAFGEHGYFTHPRYLHESLIHIPMILSAPNASSRSIQQAVSTIDIVPTALSWLGLSCPLPGSSLLPGLEDNQSAWDHAGIAFAAVQGEDADSGLRRFAARQNHWKWIVTRDITTGEIVNDQGFDLQKDASETAPLEESDPELDKLRQKLYEFSADHLSTAKPEATAKSDEIGERLEALGYR